MVRWLPWRGRLIRHAYGYGSGGIDDGLIATPRGKKGLCLSEFEIQLA